MRRTCCFYLIIILLFSALFNACSNKHIGVQEGDESIFYSLTNTKNSKDYVFDNDEYKAVNAFLSVFTRTGYMKNSSFSLTNSTDIEFLKLVRLIIVIQSSEPLKTVNIKNSVYYKISENRLNAFLINYFDVTVLPQDDDFMFYDEGYYYWSKAETENHINASFALIDRIEDLGNGYYSINFSLFNSKSSFGDTFKEKYLNFSRTEAVLQFPRGRIDNLNAVINTEDLSNTDAMQLVYMQKNIAA